ncbi:ABC transporter ATP-binding protein [Pelagibius sp. CAU 1746]|uniref:ABC transporter ATP-binding protein n=1 Tax=Pelagibius sp. CAU 1746 TaxID=3140370 RepID=UPI00325B5791
MEDEAPALLQLRDEGRRHCRVSHLGAVAVLFLGAALHQTRVGDGCRRLVDARKALAVGIGDGGVGPARQVLEGGLFPIQSLGIPGRMPFSVDIILEYDIPNMKLTTLQAVRMPPDHWNEQMHPADGACDTGNAPLSPDLALEIVDLRICYGDHEAVRGVTISAKAGTHLTLVGPSGCGKTTILRSIAGLEKPSSGRISLFGKPVYDSSMNIEVATEKRDVSMVFQSYAIWPHMSVFENVAYGLRLRRVPKAEIEERVIRALSMVGLKEQAYRQSTMLSGGQQQRVALARSFVFDPKILLFDEPLSNLDAKLRAQMRVELKELTTRLGITAVYVTHDQEEALSMSDHVVVLQDGIVRQQTDPFTAYFRPENAFVADFMGVSNFLPIAGAAREIAGGLVEADLTDGGKVICAGAVPDKEVAGVAIKASHLQPQAEPPESGDNVWRMEVTHRSFVGDLMEYHLDWEGRELRARTLSSRVFDVGDKVYCSVAPEHAVLVAP